MRSSTGSKPLQVQIEVKNYVPTRLDWYKSLGCFTEIVYYKTRLFVPVDWAEPIIGKLTG